MQLNEQQKPFVFIKSLRFQKEKYEWKTTFISKTTEHPVNIQTVMKSVYELRQP